MSLQVGLGVAVDYCLQLGVADSIWPRIQKLAHILRAGLMALPGVHVWDQGRVLCGIVSFTKVGSTVAQLPDYLLRVAGSARSGGNS